MSKYNTYAQQLDKTFKEARDKYAALYDALQEANRQYVAAQVWQPEVHVGDNERRMLIAKSALAEAQNKLNADGKHVWDDFRAARAQIKENLERSVQANNIASPDAVDANALELLKSGVLTVDDFESFTVRYDDNPTMLRLVSKYAKEAAIAEGENRAIRARLNVVAETASSGKSTVQRQWDALSGATDYCGGLIENRHSTPSHIVAMGKRWEELSTQAIKDF